MWDGCCVCCVRIKAISKRQFRCSLGFTVDLMYVTYGGKVSLTEVKCHGHTDNNISPRFLG
jgi:hypothetical protein